jgi:hypothetical protein
MNCLDYRRVLLAGERESAEMKAHRLQCGACAQHLREHAAFESDLKRALEVPVSAGLEEILADRIVLKRRRFLAAAAVSALALGAGAYAWLGRDGPLALACIEFVMKEEAKAIMMGAMPRAEAQAALAGSLPLERIERLGRLRHIGPCPFNGAIAYHAVLEVPQGKVTLLVMPGASVRPTQRGERDGLHAAVVALRNASVGIIGGDAGVVDSIAGALRG